MHEQLTQHTQLTEEHSSHELQTIASDVQFVFGFNVQISQICDLFEIVARDTNFQLIESEQYHATAIKQKKKNFIQLLDCFNFWSEGNVTAIKMTITTREKDSKRICRVRGLIGSRKQVIEFIRMFTDKSKKLANSKQISHEQEFDIRQQQTNPFYLQSCAVYMFHKILSNEKYGIGNIIYSSIKNFNSEYQEATECYKLIPAPMKKAVNITEEVVENLYKDFNYGRSQMEQIMPYCRISVQKYVFEKINVTLSSLYLFKNQEIESQFQEKVIKIRKEYSLRNIFKETGIPQKLQFIQADSPDLDSVGILLKSETTKKYIKAARQLQRITSTMSPRQKLKHCQIMYTYLKTIIYEQSKGKQQLFNMQDIIPVMIFIILICEIQHLKSQLQMMLDFIYFDPCDLQSEKRLIVNLTESLNYIVRDWKL